MAQVTYYPKNENLGLIEKAALEKKLTRNAMLDLIVSSYFGVKPFSLAPQLDERVEQLGKDVERMKEALSKAGVKF